MARRVRAQPWTGRLPAEVTTFVDRRREVADVRRLLSAARLVTLTGVGGTGKSRLAVRVAGDLRRGYADGVWHINIAELGDPSVLEYAIGQTLGVRAELSVRDDNEVPLDRRLIDRRLIDHLAERELLLVLDDCEHLIDACAALIDVLLRSAPRLRILCTSRQPLDVVGETVWTVPPLPVPNGDEAGRYAAIDLFVDRAGAVVPGFALDPANRPTVIAICDRLDGLPLAIELAAAQLRTLSLGQLADGLADRFRLLSTRHAAPARHRGLQETFDWSYTLCSPAERALWARAAVFAGSFDLEAATAICADEEVPAGSTLDVLAGLVDKSVAIREDVGGQVRYRLLETVREYGLDRLRALGDQPAEDLHSRSRDWYVRLAEAFDAEWFGPHQLRWSVRMRAELPNVRAVLSRCLAAPDDLTAALRLAGALDNYWRGCGAVSEGRHWLDRLLAADEAHAVPDAAAAAVRIRALSAHSHVLLTQSDLAGAAESVGRSRELAGRLGDQAHLAITTVDLALLELFRGGDPVRARAPLEEALAEYARAGQGDPMVEATARISLAVVLLKQGDVEGAQQVCAQLAALCERHGELWMRAHVMGVAAWAALAAGDSTRAATYGRESLRLHHSLGDTFGMAMAFQVVALAFGDSDHHLDSVRLLGFCDELSPTTGPRATGPELFGGSRGDLLTRARRALGDGPVEAAYRHGRQLSLDEAITSALAADLLTPVGNARHRPGLRSARTHLPGPTVAENPDVKVLTPRETEVAALIAEGLSNKQIAARLVTSRRTAESHVENILRKLGFTSRTQVAAWMAQRRLR